MRSQGRLLSTRPYRVQQLHTAEGRSIDATAAPGASTTAAPSMPAATPAALHAGQRTEEVPPLTAAGAAQQDTLSPAKQPMPLTRPDTAGAVLAGSETYLASLCHPPDPSEVCATAEAWGEGDR